MKADELIPLLLFTTFKNEGLAIFFCISLLAENAAYIASIPCVLAIVFEMGWAAYLEVKKISQKMDTGKEKYG